MNYSKIILSLILFVSCSYGQFDIFASSGDKIPDIDSLICIVSQYDVIFLGVENFDSISNVLDYEIFDALTEKNKDIALSLEILEADNQGIVNDFLVGKISGQELHVASNIDINILQIFLPLIKLAKNKGLPVIAANIPKRFCRIVSHFGIEELGSLSEQEQKILPQQTFFFNDQYKELFKERLQEQKTQLEKQDENFNNLYQSHCLADEKMAESISNFLLQNPGFKVFMINNSFHSDYRLGIVQKLNIRSPMLRIVTIKNFPVPKMAKIDYNQLLDKSDFLILTFQ